MPIANKEKEMLARFGKKMLSHGLTTGTGGNLSLVDRKDNQVVITPSGIGYDVLTPDDMVVCDLNGNVLNGPMKPSSELGFHLALYGFRKDIQAIVHTHSVYATTLACMHLEIPAVHYLVGFAGPKVPLSPYETFGTQALADAIISTVGRSNAVLLANHGLVAMGVDLQNAFTIAEEIEFVARVYYQSLAAGEPKVLSDEQMEKVLIKFRTYGQR